MVQRSSLRYDSKVSLQTYVGFCRTIRDSALLGLLIILRGKTLREQGIKIACTVPEVKAVEGIFRLWLTLGTDLKFETMCQMTFRRDVGKEVRDIREFRVLRAEAALQINVVFDLGLRHDGYACNSSQPVSNTDVAKCKEKGLARGE